jgi:predicted nucleic acid-binding protein
LLDANILCRIARPDDPQHAVARDALRTLILSNEELVITPQVVREFWDVATRPRVNNGLGMTPAEAAAGVQSFGEFASCRTDCTAAYEIWKRLVVEYQVAGKEAHDANHVAAMQAHGIGAILTFDCADFRRYERLVSIQSPAEILAGPDAE